MNLNDLLKLTFEKRASDLHVKVGRAADPQDRREAHPAREREAADPGRRDERSLSAS